jgi:hypothetical protein
MTRTTGFTDPDGRSGEALTVVLARTGRQPRLVDPVSTAFMVDETARTKFGNRQEAGTLEERRPCAWKARCRNEGIKRKPREVVAGQEPFGREIAVGVEVRTSAVLTCLEHLLLVRRLIPFGPLWKRGPPPQQLWLRF